MEKEFVSYELALRLKALGFDEPCLAVFELIVDGDVIPKFRYNWDSEGKWFDHNKVKSEYKEHNWYWSAPTFSQAFRWFREKHDMAHQITYAGAKGRYNAFTDDWVYDSIGELKEFSYEEAELACLDKLIEIVEETEAKTINI